MVKDPSREKVAGAYIIGALDTAPTHNNSGFDVSDLSSVLISVHPTTPNLAATPAGFAGVFRLWRFKAETRQGQATGSGQWFSDTDVTLLFDGTGQMEVTAPTDNSTKMFLQLVSVVNPPGNYLLAVTPYKLVKRKSDGSDMVTAVIPEVNVNATVQTEATPTTIPQGRSLYSTDNNEQWSAVFSAATELILSDTATGLLFPAITSRQIIAVVHYDVTANILPTYYYRHDTQFTYTLATGAVTVPNAVFAAGDNFVIYWEDVTKAVGIHGAIPHADAAGFSLFDQNGAIARSSDPAVVDNGDVVALIADLVGKLVIAGYTWASDSNRVEEIDPLNEKSVEDTGVDTTNLLSAGSPHYYPSVAGSAMQGYKDLSFTGYFNDADGTLTLAVWGTNDDDPAATDWVDVSASGYRSDTDTTSSAPTVTNTALTFGWDFDNFNYKYYRFAVTNTGDTNTVIVKPRRKAL